MFNTATTLTSTPTFMHNRHSFHILGPSTYPSLVGIFLFTLLVPLTFYMHGVALPLVSRPFIVHMSFIGLFIVVMRGFFAILAESRGGYHTAKVQLGLRMGMLLFIASEVMFFFAFFGAFFHFSLVPSIAVGAIGPPTGTQVLDVGGLPLVNTLLLLTSGVTITAAHAYILEDEQEGFLGYLLLTILLGVTFLFCQAYEYKYGVKFSGRDNIYGSIFFITTGFHGLHVTIGTLFLAFCGFRQFVTTGLEGVVATLYSQQNSHVGTLLSGLRALQGNPIAVRSGAMTPAQHFGFEAAAWYGHFVDVVGLFLFLTVYGGGGV